MHQCILKLLKSADEDSYECLCRLLATIGKDIDHEKAKVCENFILFEIIHVCDIILIDFFWGESSQNVHAAS